MEEENNNKKGIVTTILLHMVLLLLFAFFGMSYTIPPPPEEGITINFGFEDQGRNVENVSEELQEEVVEETTDAVNEEVIEEEILSQEIEETASLEQEKEKEKPNEEIIKDEPKPDKNLSSALNKWKTKKSNEQASDGETGQSGNQGSLEGDQNSNNYTGGDSGNGTEFNLSGRSMIASPKIDDNSQEDGQVVVDIIVDRYGNVLRANPGARGSTTTNNMLYKKAKEAALKTKFNANPNAAAEQKGQMTFKFILN